MSEAYDFLAKGGVLMIPILLCSVVALAIFLERLWSLRKVKVIPSTFLQKVTKLIHLRQFDRASDLCDRASSGIAHILSAGLRQAGKDRATIKEVMEEAGRRVAANLERGTGVLSSVVAIAPLLGLLGTVTGMIKVFQRVVNQVGADGAGQVNAGALASGIWEALITTAAGLSVAIIAFLMFKMVTTQVDRLLVEMEEQALDLAESMVGETQAATADPATDAQEAGA